MFSPVLFLVCWLVVDVCPHSSCPKKCTCHQQHIQQNDIHVNDNNLLMKRSGSYANNNILDNNNNNYNNNNLKVITNNNVNALTYQEVPAEIQLTTLTRVICVSINMSSVSRKFAGSIPPTGH
ncbi:hypothetical protein HELRODRAFT_177665 [Helobdella robusta]|uniref:Uncharacterized protein n=1 Tax=Helobdella robusta TaxID=6412 RepID=T1FC14_HELRO|nr:hypothetical protein HELRODRAFT_177665 [Helobdella robusta]ESN97992.1 hypothetical protein HELRODRAFT_177665 [Helobdella robusta]